MKVDIFQTTNKYDIIYADPPWTYNDRMKVQGANGLIRGAQSYYDCMSLDELKALPVSALASENAILFMWCTMPLLDKAFEVMNAWGFSYKTCGFTWIKTTQTGKIFTGMGHYTRGNAELCLIGVRDKKPKILSHSVQQIVMSPKRDHSRKPAEVRERIVELVGDLPKIELFARERVSGWDCWGKEA